MSLYNLDWLGGNGYNVASFTFPVMYTGPGSKSKSHESGGTPLGEKMNFSVVMPEDMPDPIATGREELGINKVFQTITNVQRYGDGTVASSLSHNGTTFLELSGVINAYVLNPEMFAAQCITPILNVMIPTSDMITIRSLPLADHCEYIRVKGGGANKLQMREIATGSGAVKWTLPTGGGGTQAELMSFLDNMEPQGVIDFTYVRVVGLAGMLDTEVMHKLPSLDAYLASILTSARIPLTPRETRRVDITCSCDIGKLQALFPEATSGQVTLTLSIFALFGRKMSSMRLSTNTMSGEVVMVQFESDPEMVYLTREQFGAPSMPASIDITDASSSLLLQVGWNATNHGRAHKKTPHVFFNANLAFSESQRDAPNGDKDLLHCYTMTAPGNGEAAGAKSQKGYWGIPMDDKKVMLKEVLSNTSYARALAITDGSFHFRNVTRHECATSYICLNRLADLGLLPTGAQMYNADVKLTVLHETST